MTDKLKKNQLNEFTYTKKDGSTSHREVFIVGVPTDLYFGIDLSDFNSDEKEIYLPELEEIYAHFKKKLEAEIEMLGLSSYYRNFKEDGVS